MFTGQRNLNSPGYLLAHACPKDKPEDYYTLTAGGIFCPARGIRPVIRRNLMERNHSDLILSILEQLPQMEHIKLSEIPNIDLYMDQVTSFMEEHMQHSKRRSEDKILTKTMINNYAKNKLLPPPAKKRYSKEHMLLLIFIYYFKGILSLNDIQSLMKPVTERFFHGEDGFNIEDIYREVYALGKEQISVIREDLKRTYEKASVSFENAPKDEQDFLQIFCFI